MNHRMILLFLSGAGADAYAAGLLLDQPLQGSTSGTRLGGAFVTGGWQVTDQYDAIYWHVTPTPHGRFEFDIRGLGSGCSGVGGGANEFCDMYDWTYANSDNSYIPGFRENPYKMLALKRCEGVQNDRLKTVWKILDDDDELNSAVLSWNAATTYHFRFDWGPDGNGNSVIRSFRDGLEYLTVTVSGTWNPVGQSVRIGASTRRQDEGAPVGAIYSNVKVWNLDEIAPVIAEVSPDPHSARVGLPYTRQLTLVAGTLPITWSLPQKPVGAQINSEGLVTGWTPSTGELNSAVGFQARADNGSGFDTESWSVHVRSRSDLDLDGDADQSDFGLFQRCLTGSLNVYSPGCEPSDLDLDLDVDGTDLDIFLSCMNGAHQTPGC
jgi:hypothetical protein